MNISDIIIGQLVAGRSGGQATTETAEPTPFATVTYNASGTFDPANYVGYKYIKVELWNGGGGGSGGAGQFYSGANTMGGAGGAGGAYFKETVQAGAITGPVAVTVGAGGAGGLAMARTSDLMDATSYGSDGGVSSFGSIVIMPRSTVAKGGATYMNPNAFNSFSTGGSGLPGLAAYFKDQAIVSELSGGVGSSFTVHAPTTSTFTQNMSTGGGSALGGGGGGAGIVYKASSPNITTTTLPTQGRPSFMGGGGGGGGGGQNSFTGITPGGDSIYGGAGGAGGNSQAVAADRAGKNGVAPGGGGGGGGCGSSNSQQYSGGNGAAGRVVITVYK